MYVSKDMCDIFSLSLGVIRILSCENFHYRIEFLLSCHAGRDQIGQNLITGGITKDIILLDYFALYVVIQVFRGKLQCVIKTVS